MHVMVRPVFGAATGLAVAAAVIAVSLPAAARRSDERNLARAQHVAHTLRLPDGATRSLQCRGDGLVTCVRIDAPVTDVAHRMAVALRVGGGGRAVEQRCSPVTVGATHLRADECDVSLRFGHRGVFVTVTPVLGSRAGRPAVTSTLVSVSAS